MAAAVPDFRAPYQTHKIRRSEALTLTLTPTPDILQALSVIKSHQKMVGFCLGDEANLIEMAQEKLRKKNLDLVIANTHHNVGSSMRQGVMVSRTQQLPLDSMPVLDFCAHILKRIVEIS